MLELVGWVALGLGVLIASTVGGVAGFGAGSSRSARRLVGGKATLGAVNK
jgi:hypothetical protein